MKSLLLLVLTALLGHSVAASKRAALSCNCGWTNSGRVVGGTEAVPNRYPWMASLKVMWETICGASIITQRHALTAAHCTENLFPLVMRLVVGTHNLKSKHISIPIKKVIDHELYSKKDKDTNFDISILVTSKDIPFSKTVGPTCLPSKPLSLDYNYIKVMGWGDTTDGGKSSNVLLEADVQVVPTWQCSRYWGSLQQKLCTYAVKKDSCQGDSGGPLVWLDPETNRYTQVALVSYGSGCGGPLPSVNTDVSTYIEWINEKIDSSRPGLQACIKIG